MRARDPERFGDRAVPDALTAKPDVAADEAELCAARCLVAPCDALDGGGLPFGEQHPRPRIGVEQRRAELLGDETGDGVSRNASR